MEGSIEEPDSELENNNNKILKINNLLIPCNQKYSNNNNYFISEIDKSDKKCEKIFLKSNYKYKRRYSLLSDINYFILIISETLKQLRNTSHVRCIKMLNNCPFGVFLLFAIVMTLGFADLTEAGVCWINRLENGKCKEIYSKNITREECCGRSQEFGFTEKELSEVEFFFAMALSDGTNCESCLDSCSVAKCGPGKRCVIRKGRPKCICAPICKSAKDKKPLKLNPIRVIDVAQKEQLLQQFNFGDILSNDKKLHDSNSDSIINDKLNINKKRKRCETDGILSTTNNSDIDNINKSTITIVSEKKKNQRKLNSNMKKRKHNNHNNHTNLITTSTIIPPIDVEQIHLSTLERGLSSTTKNDKIIIAEAILNPNHNNLGRFDNSIKRKKNMNMNSKNIVTVQNSDTILDHRDHHYRKNIQHEHRSHHQHHGRHQYKKQRKFKEQRGQNGTNIGRRKKFNHHQSQRIQQQHYFENQNHQHSNVNSGIDGDIDDSSISGSGITLDEKIRSGFFNYGFPYPSNDLTQVAHGRYYNPVCGTDGKTYKTECQLKKRACRRDSTTLTVAYRGHCQTSCRLVKCLHGLSCVEDQYGIPHCVLCKIQCPKDDASTIIDPGRAVCGVDGRTYKSVCDINRLICTTGRSISVAYDGPCQDAANCNIIQCGEKNICLNDLVSHMPRCISCSFKCPRRRRPQGQRYEDVKICGNNNHTYNSWCQMRRDSCNTGFYIDVRHIGPCHINSFATNLGISQF